MSFHKIVIAADLEAASLKTLSKVNNLQLDKCTEIHIVHVFELVLYGLELIPLLPPSPSQEDYLLIEKYVVEKLEKIKSDLGLGNRQNVVLKCLISENARQEFLQYVDTVRPDLVVASSQEKAGMRGLFEGSFTSFLSKFCRYDLLILRPEH